MARLVCHEAMGPAEVKVGGESVWICQCGLSQDLPFCDNSHEKTVNETPGQICVYDRTRTKVIEQRENF
ncbi:MAG TPA: CDGSH iron-sulfur domain-containing protein [Tepidisphaeraceae bacterium]|jgi:CDGSH-type Zn-finger protein